jgi:outer membrane protein, heavy metal efflux system
MKNFSIVKNLFLPGLIFSFVILSTTFIAAQSTIEAVLSSILKNNKSLLANNQFREFRKLEYNTGLYPSNPQVEYDYLSGSPDEAGNQTEFTVFQSFDFPSSYFKKKQISNQQELLSEHQLLSNRQDVLLEAKLVCIELVYRNKLNKELHQQKENVQTLLENFETKLDKGEGNILDVNKARLQLISINREYQDNISSINRLNAKLVSLNGGNEIAFFDTVYFAIPDIPAFEQLEKQYESADPIRKILEQEKIIVQKELELTRILSYPKFEAGYHYQGILGQKYEGIHTGITIPLWENKNTVKAKKSKLLFADLEIEEHKTDHYFEIKQLYERYLNLKITVDEYKNTLNNVNTVYLLNKSLTAGHISAIEYFMELNYYAETFNSYLQMEKEYYQSIAELYKYEL